MNIPNVIYRLEQCFDHTTIIGELLRTKIDKVRAEHKFEDNKKVATALRAIGQHLIWVADIFEQKSEALEESLIDHKEAA